MDHRGARVLVLTGSLRPGGTEIAVYRMALALHARGRYQPHVVVLCGADSMGEELRRTGIPVDDLAIDGRLYGPAGWAGLSRLYGLLRRTRPAIVHTFLFDADLMGPLVAPLVRARTITTRRAVKRGKHRQLSAYRMTNSLAARIVANSEEVRRFTLEVERAPAEKVLVIPNGIETQRFAGGNRSRLRAELGIAETAMVVGTMGRLKHVKGQDVLFEAMLPLLRHSRDLVVLVTGEASTPFGADLASRAAQEGVGDRFRLLGNRDDIADCLAAFDVFVLPSRSEGMSNALIEAMAAGRPIVATAVGGNSEALDHGGCGRLVPPEDPAAMGEAVAALLRDPGERARLSAAATARAGSEYDFSTMMDRTERLYDEVLAPA